MQFYIHREGQQSGPYSVDELESHLASGELLVDDLVWYEGAPEWAPLQTLVTVVVENEEAVPEEHVESIVPDVEPEPIVRGTPSWVPSRRDGSTPEPTPFVAANRELAARPVPIPPDPFATTEDKPVRRSSRREEFNPNRGGAIQAIVLGALLFVGGLFVSGITYFVAAAHPGVEKYYVAWGASALGVIGMIVGVIQFYKK